MLRSFWNSLHLFWLFLSNVKTSGRFFQIFVTFLENLNLNLVSIFCPHICVQDLVCKVLEINWQHIFFSTVWAQIQVAVLWLYWVGKLEPNCAIVWNNSALLSCWKIQLLLNLFMKRPREMTHHQGNLLKGIEIKPVWR